MGTRRKGTVGWIVSTYMIYNGSYSLNRHLELLYVIQQSYTHTTSGEGKRGTEDVGDYQSCTTLFAVNSTYPEPGSALQQDQIHRHKLKMYNIHHIASGN